jgi:hypothetical protein
MQMAVMAWKVFMSQTCAPCINHHDAPPACLNRWVVRGSLDLAMSCSLPAGMGSLKHSALVHPRIRDPSGRLGMSGSTLGVQYDADLDMGQV